MCEASASERVLAEPFWKAPRSPDRSSRWLWALRCQSSRWKARDFYSRAILQSSRSAFACLFFVRSVFYLRAILKSSRFLLTRLSLCAALSCQQAILKSSLTLCYSQAILKSTRSLFACLFLSATSSIYAPFFVRSISYSQAILKSSQSLFARHSEKHCVFFFFGFAQWNMSLVVLYISLPLCMGENNSWFKKTFCLMNIHPQDLLSHEPTLLV